MNQACAETTIGECHDVHYIIHIEGSPKELATACDFELAAYIVRVHNSRLLAFQGSTGRRKTYQYIVNKTKIKE